MKIGIDCFKDEQLRSIIESENNKGYCEIQHIDNVFIYDTDIKHEDDLQENISSILGLYVPVNGLDKEEDKIENRIKSDWNIFTVSPEDIRKIILSICGDEYSEDDLLFQHAVKMNILEDKDFLAKERLTEKKTWEEFSESIKHENRFQQHFNVTILKSLFGSESLHHRLPHTEKLYRSRIDPKGELKKENMGAPPANLASAGRVNSEGIPCLYLANDIITTLHEIRARDFDDIAVATFMPKKDLEVIDLTELDKISSFSTADDFSLERFAVNMEILHKISNDIAKPLRRQDSILDYLPSQYIADCIKDMGYAGIRFKSTLNPDKGVNYAIFNEENFECIDIEHIRVNLQYGYQKISNTELTVNFTVVT